jgi:photosystem II stability/assembly factor-like uncharacterized protein
MANTDPPADPPPADPDAPGPDGPETSIPFERQPLQIDAAFVVKQRWQQGSANELERPLVPDAPPDIDDDVQGDTPDPAPTLNARVSKPGDAPAKATGSRAPRHAADTAGEPDGTRHNWVPTGPRNVGGRVRTLAIHPTDPKTMYAGAASGGVFKSVDGGETWFALWHDEPSLSMASLSVCRDHPDVVWVATGESQAGGGETIAGHGVYRSADAGQTWTTTPDPPVGGIALNGLQFDAIAAHPVDANTAWLVGDSGIYRTTNGGQGWTQFSTQPFTDLAFSQDAGAQPTLFLVPGQGIANRPYVVRIDPNRADAAILADLPAGTDPVAGVRTTMPAHPANPAPAPGQGKIAVSPSNRQVAYVRFTTSAGGHYGVFRAQDAQSAAANALTWRRLADHPDFATERQGRYNLTLAVSPVDPNHLASGMVELYVHRTANDGAALGANGWIRAMAWDLYHLDRGHHADHHQSLFAPQPAAPFGGGAGAPIALWDVNDGGISRSLTWLTGAGYHAGIFSPSTTQPLQANPITWTKRSLGITAPQMYDLSQSPIVPTLYGCGFQDNGVFVATGGPSWQLVLTADGGFIAFDPDDPYRFLATWQAGIADGRFPGQIRGSLGAIGEAAIDILWPRILEDGFLPVDRAAFVAETVFHPTRPGRVLHVRRNRLYGTQPTTGDRWQPEPLGCAVELLHSAAAAGATEAMLEVRHTAGALKLGLLPQLNRATADDGRPITARVRTMARQPFALDPADTLLLRLDGAAVDTPVAFAASAAMPDPAHATAAQLARHISDATGGAVRALPVVLPPSGSVVLMTTAVGNAATLTMAGDAANTLDVEARVHRGVDGSSPLPAFVDLTGGGDLTGQKLTVTVAGGPVTVDFDLDVPNRKLVTSADVAAALRTKLAGQPVLVFDHDLTIGVRFTATAAGVDVRLDRDAPGRMSLQPGRRGRSLVTNQGLLSFSFTRAAVTPPAVAVDMRLRIRDGGATDRTVTFTAGGALGGLSNVMPGELVGAVRTAIAGSPLRVRCDLDVFPAHDPAWESSLEGEVTEINMPVGLPDVAWVGDQAGRLYRTANGGGEWLGVPDPPFTGRRGRVEAIAIHPDKPNRVFVAAYQEGPADVLPGFVYMTENDGAVWQHVGDTLKDAAGKFVGVNALEVDPQDPDVLFAATDIGVFRTTNAGGRWDTFNEGLPNTLMRDLAFVPSTRMLRVGAWGRGTFERHIGPRPAKDVVLALRANAADLGGERPPPAGLDLLALVPTSVPQHQSPDIKATRVLLGQITDIDGIAHDADAAVVERRTLVDAVEMDDIVPDDVVPGATHVLVQVHNRGSFPTTGVRVVVLWAPADAGPPPLPDDFWTGLAAGTFAANDAKGAWFVVGDTTLPAHGADHDRVAPGEPRVLHLPHTWPPTVTTARRVGLLAVVSCADDPLAAAPPLDVIDLLASEPKSGYHESRVARPDEDGRFVLRSTGAAPFTTAAPGAGVSAAPGLALANAGPVTELLATNAEPFDVSLDGAQPRGFRITATREVIVSFAAGDPALPDATQVRATDAANVINRAVLPLGLPMRALSGQFAGTTDTAIFLRTRGRARLTLAATPAATTMGLATGGSHTQLVTANAAHGAPWNLAGQQLHITVASDEVISFPAGTPEIAHLAAARGFEIRAAINRQLDLARVPVRAEPRRHELAVRRSITEEAGARARTSGGRLADLVASTPPVNGDDARRALFDLVTVHGEDTVTAATATHLYLRTTNTGNIALAAVRHRVFVLGATVPVGTTQVGGDQAADIAAGASSLTAFDWDAAGTVAGTRVLVLAVADHADRPVDVPASFPTFADLDAFCAANPGAAYRELRIV